MADISALNPAAIVAAGMASFVASGVWYAVLNAPLTRLQRQWRGTAAAVESKWAFAGFAGAQLVLAAVVAYLFASVGVTGLDEALPLAALLWLGFCLTQWVGSILGEGVPARLAAIHGGDWLLHLLIIGAIVGVWR
jgi:hypothetical protein